MEGGLPEESFVALQSIYLRSTGPTHPVPPGIGLGERLLAPPGILRAVNWSSLIIKPPTPRAGSCSMPGPHLVPSPSTTTEIPLALPQQDCSMRWWGRTP